MLCSKLHCLRVSKVASVCPLERGWSRVGLSSGYRGEEASLRSRGHRTPADGSGFKVQGSGFRVQGSGFRVQGPGFRVGVVVTVHLQMGGRLSRNVKWFRGGLVFQAHRLLYHSTLGSRVIKKKKRMGGRRPACHLGMYPDTPIPIGTVLNLRSNPSQKRAAVPRRARIKGS
jgi:hypothetical protein